MKDIIINDNEEYVYQIKVPKDRIAVFIGEKGKTKKELEDNLNVKVLVDSREGEVTLLSKDSFRLFIVKDVIKAIARGFNPEIALQLLKSDYIFELIDISDYANTKNSLIRLKGRVIGVKGKSRTTIEHLTNTFISVYGKTIGIIGYVDDVSIAKKAIESLLSGSQHATVFKWLEKQRKMKKYLEW